MAGEQLFAARRIDLDEEDRISDDERVNTKGGDLGAILGALYVAP